MMRTVSLSEAVAATGLSTAALHRRVRMGLIPDVRDERGRRCIPLSAVRAIRRKGRAPGGRPPSARVACLRAIVAGRVVVEGRRWIVDGVPLYTRLRRDLIALSLATDEAAITEEGRRVLRMWAKPTTDAT